MTAVSLATLPRSRIDFLRRPLDLLLLRWLRELDRPAQYRQHRSPDSIQKFRIETNNYKAELGRFVSGIVHILTKPGMNDCHGSAFEYDRNTDFSAHDWE